MRPAALIPLLFSTAWAGDFPRTLEAFRGSTPVIDGKLDPGEWPDKASFQGPLQLNRAQRDAGASGSTDRHRGRPGVLRAQNWISQFSPVTDPQDLSFTGWMKHDGRRLYLAIDVTDDVLYGIDTPRWLPPNNPKAHELTREGWPWFGDEIELLIHAGAKWKGDEGAAGDGSSWQMVLNLTKSRLGGVGKGGLLEGEPRSSLAAWNTYRRWIESGAMEGAARVKPGGKGYTMEWAVSFDPCLEIEPGRFYSPALGDRAFGLNIAVGDLDRPEDGQGNFGNFRHEEWFAGAKNVRTQLRYWGTLWIRNSSSAAARP